MTVKDLSETSPLTPPSSHRASRLQITGKLEATGSVWPELQPLGRLRWMAGLSPGPNLDGLQTREAPSRRCPSGPLLWSDWEKPTTVPPSGERCHLAWTCRLLRTLLADVNLQVVQSRPPLAEGLSLEPPGPQLEARGIEAWTGVVLDPWTAVCTNLGHKS